MEPFADLRAASHHHLGKCLPELTCLGHFGIPHRKVIPMMVDSQSFISSIGGHFQGAWECSPRQLENLTGRLLVCLFVSIGVSRRGFESRFMPSIGR